MCWIFWYSWDNTKTHKILLHWLEKLEYRGYDSAWIFVWNNEWKYKVVKAVWKVSSLTEKVYNHIKDDENYTFGIAHTRWATHWWVTENNTHPHYDTNQNFFLVHNWIIENYKKLKDNLIKKWYQFYWETDSEVVAKLIEDSWKWSLLNTVEFILPMLEWAYAFLIVSKDSHGEIIWVKYWSPLVFGYNEKDKEFFFSSDTQALAWLVDEVIFLDDWELVHIKNKEYIVKSEWKLVNKSKEKIDIESLKAEKWDYKHFMLKEIFEQPDVLKEVFRWRIDFENKLLIAAAFQELDKYEFNKVVFVACWTSYNAWWLGTYWLQDLAWIESYAEIASEFESKNIKVDPKTLYVFISQSWETADTIAPLKHIKARWWKTFGIVNVVWSTISRLTDFGLFTRAWTEVWVASTKAFTAQIWVIMLLALYFADKNGISKAKFEKIISQLNALPEYILRILASAPKIKDIAKQICNYKNFFFLGRHSHLPIAFESSLKFKEISYLASQAAAAWELKHWPLALIEESFPTVFFAPNDIVFEKNISSIHEIKARNGKVLAISDKEIDNIDWFIQIPTIVEELYPFMSAVIWQLLSYYVADILWRDIDKPRNLAKSVTVK